MIRTLERLQSQVRRGFAAGSEIRETAAFRVHIWHTADVFYRNRALAMRRPASWQPAIAEMESVFASAERVPRIELLAELWPELAPALERAGWVCEARGMAMALEAPAFAAVPGQAHVTLIGADAPRALVRGFVRGTEQAFDMIPSPEQGGEIDVLRRDLASGTALCAASLVDGRPVSGASLIGIGADAELAGVWTTDGERRQGRAEAVCRTLLGHFFAHGGELVWLSTSDDESGRLYRRLGFAPVGTQLNYAKLRSKR